MAIENLLNDLIDDREINIDALKSCFAIPEVAKLNFVKISLGGCEMKISCCCLRLNL